MLGCLNGFHGAFLMVSPLGLRMVFLRLHLAPSPGLKAGNEWSFWTRHFSRLPKKGEKGDHQGHPHGEVFFLQQGSLLEDPAAAKLVGEGFSFEASKKET